MKIRKILLVIGIITSILGLIFHLQGQSIVGPESSFMYSNPDWITFGIQIMIMGIIIAVIGFGINFIKKISSSHEG
jgi:hypothetical protein